jgi:ribosomal protein S6E (S10)
VDDPVIEGVSGGTGMAMARPGVTTSRRARALLEKKATEDIL